MSHSILLLTDRGDSDWPSDHLIQMDKSLSSLSKWYNEHAKGLEQDFVLCWFREEALPSVENLNALIAIPGQVKHCGLSTGVGDVISAFDYISPAWTQLTHASKDIVSTSWRLSLDACLIPTEVLKQCDFVNAGMKEFHAASLELGMRWAQHGVVLRHCPQLLPSPEAKCPDVTCDSDNLILLQSRASRSIYKWALLRMLLSNSLSWKHLSRLFQAQPQSTEDKIFRHAKVPSKSHPGAKVSVLIPTIDRYSFLFPLLEQLETQTHFPHEVVVVDQTPMEKRDKNYGEKYPKLPLKVIYQDQPGQCSSRNAGIRSMTGTHILFIDDDVEIEPDFIQKHLDSLSHYQAEVSCGVMEEAGAGPLPKAFTYLRSSDVFPTCNAMIESECLKKSGLFDLAYNRLPRADADLGMRLYQSGFLMILNPDISLFHYHAPMGGLRTHKARVITHASSRQKLFQWHLPSISEVYMSKRYFKTHHTREMLWQRLAGTMAVKGSRSRKFLKLMIALCMLPISGLRINRRAQSAQDMMSSYPQIPVYDKDQGIYTE